MYNHRTIYSGSSCASSSGVPTSPVGGAFLYIYIYMYIYMLRISYFYGQIAYGMWIQDGWADLVAGVGRNHFGSSTNPGQVIAEGKAHAHSNTF